MLWDITDEVTVTLRGAYSHQGGVGWASKIQGDYPDPFLFSGTQLNPPAPFYAYMYADPYHSTVNGNPMEPNPSDPRQIRRDARQFQDIDTWDVNGTLVWDFYMPALGDMSFSVVGSYRDEVRLQNFDVDLSDQDMIVSNVSASTRDRVIDAHLRSEGDTSTEWLLGFFFLDADGQLNIDLPGGGGASTIYRGAAGRICSGATEPPFPCVPLPPLFATLGDIQLLGARTGGSNDTLSLAGYAHLRHKFFEDVLRVGLGVRYSYDRSRATRYNDEVSALSPGSTAFGALVFPPGDNCLQPGTSTDQEASWDGITGDFKLEFVPDEEHMVYVSVSHGYKPGYINGNAVGLGCGDPLNPDGPIPPNITSLPNAKEETLWAYEIGSKNRFFVNTLQANVTGFVYQYENLQVASQFDNTGYIQNAPRALVRGLEFEGIWEPIEDLSLSVTYGYLNSKYLEYVGFDFATGEVADFSGNRMIRAPEHTATLAAEYLWDLGDRGSIIPRIQYFISDDIYFNASNRPEDTEPSYGTLQLRGRWQSADDDLFIEGFVQNVPDQDVRSTRSIGSGLLGRPVTVAYEPPRTWGVRIGGSY